MRSRHTLGIWGLAVMLGGVGVAIGAPAPEWKADQDHSAIGFTVKHLFTPVQGNFTGLKGSIRFDPENLEGSHYDVTIPITGVDTRNAKRDKHLQSADFFNAKQWPEMHFVSERIEKTDDTHFVLHGNPKGRPKGSYGGRIRALAVLDSLVARHKSQKALTRALEAELHRDPVAFFKNIIMPLLPRESKLAFDQESVVQWRSLLGSRTEGD